MSDINPNSGADGLRQLRNGGSYRDLPFGTPARGVAQRAFQKMYGFDEMGGTKSVPPSAVGNLNVNHSSDEKLSLADAAIGTSILLGLAAAFVAGVGMLNGWFENNDPSTNNTANPPAATSGTNGSAIPQNASDSLQTPPPVQVQAPPVQSADAPQTPEVPNSAAMFSAPPAQNSAAAPPVVPATRDSQDRDADDSTSGPASIPTSAATQNSSQANAGDASASAQYDNLSRTERARLLAEEQNRAVAAAGNWQYPAPSADDARARSMQGSARPATLVP